MKKVTELVSYLTSNAQAPPRKIPLKHQLLKQPKRDPKSSTKRLLKTLKVKALKQH